MELINYFLTAINIGGYGPSVKYFGHVELLIVLIIKYEGSPWKEFNIICNKLDPY